MARTQAPRTRPKPPREPGPAQGKAPSPVQAALDALVRPLAFASRDDFAAAARVRDLEGTLAAATARALALRLPRDLRDVLEGLAERFAKPLDDDQRVRAVREAWQRLEPFREPDWAQQALGRPLTCLPGIGPKRARTLGERGLASVSDLLFRLPARYDDRRHLSQIDELEVGRPATFVAEVVGRSWVPFRGRGGRGGFRRVLRAEVKDETGSVTLTWFRASESLERQLEPGARLLVSGDVRRHRFSLQLQHPEIELLERGDGDAHADPDGDAARALAATRRIVPVYPALEKVPPRTLRGLVARAVAEYADLVAGHLPEVLEHEQVLPPPSRALALLHDPSPELTDEEVDALQRRDSAAHRRLVLEELFVLELGLALRSQARAAEPGIALDVEAPRARAAEAALPFRLTGAQQRAWSEIRADLARRQPMHRLLQGDVGSGKTAVAFLAAAAAAASGHQTALLAPTELLAEQHARTLAELAARVAGAGGEGPRLRGALLTSSLPRAEADAVRQRLREGELDLVVGTHALLQEGVRFARLALAVVDEQHRFGVMQRASLRDKGPGGRTPDLLVMTATPIPRTLALTVYGDLDVSVIDELPPGRTPVETVLLREGEGERVVELIRATAARGEQTYVVYPLVEESERIDLRSAVQQSEHIRAAFPELRVDLVHGRQPAVERAAAMRRFAAGETQVLVSTTVIEVGVDVPNATLMVVEHAERFGLAQLHQLRGRIGRGAGASTCVLVARGGGEDSEARLRAMLETTDGFRIADADLAIRGPGELLGTRQHGALPDLRLADLARDARLVARAREAAFDAVRSAPGLAGQPELRRAVELRWGGRLGLLDAG